MSTVDKRRKRVTRRDFMKRVAAIGGTAGLAAASSGTALFMPEKAQAKTGVPAKWDYEADVVVVGYGGAGVSAAIAAKDAGASVLVLEKDSLPRGGNTGCSSGSSTIPEPLKDAATFLKMQSWGTVTDDEVCTGRAQAFLELEGWLRKLGCPLNILTTASASAGSVPASLLRGGVVSPAFSMLGGNKRRNLTFRKPDGTSGRGKDLFGFLHGAAAAKGIRLMLATPGKELVQYPETKEILGVKATAGGKDIYVRAAKGVVLATGGFENNPEMTVNYLPRVQIHLRHGYWLPVQHGRWH